MTVGARTMDSVGPGRHPSDGKGPLAVVIASAAGMAGFVTPEGPEQSGGAAQQLDMPCHGGYVFAADRASEPSDCMF
jgi:hypothetical protein